MKRSFISLLFSLLAVAAMATEPVILKGKVIDKVSKQPIPGASIYFSELNRGVVTDENGLFEFKFLPERA